MEQTFDSSNPSVPGEYPRLAQLKGAMQWSRHRLEKFREDRLKLIKQYVGFYYGDEHSVDKVPVNFLQEMATIYVQCLAASEPRVLVTTKYPQLKSFSETLSLAVNHLLSKKIGFRGTLQSSVLDAMFTLGIVKVGLNFTPNNGTNHDVAEPFADSISLDNWVHDCRADRWERCAFMGDRYELDYEFLKNSGMFNKEAVDQVQPQQKDTAESRAAQLTEGHSYWENDGLYETIEVWDIWLPKEGLILTIPGGKNAPNVVLKTTEWNGPQHGPYHFLGFNPVPDNIIGISPLFSIYDMHDAGNRVYNKLIRQAERQKVIGAVKGGEDEDAQRIQRGKDGDVFRISGNGIQEMKFGGIEQTGLAFFMNLQQLLDQMGGNLRTLGGLAPSAGTLGQDQMISAASSKRVANMQDEVYAFVQPIVRDLAWWLFYDPMVDIMLQREVPGTDLQIPVRFSQEEREGDFLDYNFEIEPFSMQRESPQTRLATVQNVINVLTPLAPMMQQQGVNINIEGYLKTVARYANMTELSDFITFGNPQQAASNPIGQPPPKMGGPSNKTYTRVSTTAPSLQGKQSAMISTLLGANVQPKESVGMMG